MKTYTLAQLRWSHYLKTRTRQNLPRPTRKEAFESGYQEGLKQGKVHARVRAELDEWLDHADAPNRED